MLAAVALLLGGVPPLLWVLGGTLFGITSLVLKLAWIISGVSSVYLLYRWYSNGMRIFGHSNKKDMLSFGVMIVSGLNLGLVGLIGTNIGMTIAASRPVFIIVAVIYLYPDIRTD